MNRKQWYDDRRREAINEADDARARIPSLVFRSMREANREEERIDRMLAIRLAKIDAAEEDYDA